MVRLFLLLAGLGLAFVGFMALGADKDAPLRHGLQHNPSTSETVTLVQHEPALRGLPETVRRLADSPVSGPLRPTIIDAAPQPSSPIVASTQIIETAAAVDSSAIFRRVKAQRANVRGGPSTSYGVVDQIAQGEEIEVLQDNGDGWVHIRIQGDGIEGWISASLLAPVAMTQ